VRSLGSRVRASFRDPHVVALSLLVLSFATLYGAVGFVLHAGFQTALLDLGLYDQAVRSYSQLRLPHVPILGVRTPTDLGALHFTDHFTPILAFLAPFYWVHDGPETLLVLHAILMAGAIPWIWQFARRALGVTSGYIVALAYAVSWPVQHAIWFPFHQVVFAVPLMAVMLERFQAGAHRQAAVAALLLLGVREDLGLLISVFGMLLLLRGSTRLGAGLAIGGVAATLFIASVLMPALGASPDRNWNYAHFATNPLRLLIALATNPIDAMEYALGPPRARTLLWLFAPTLFLAFRSPLLLLAAPLLAVRLLSNNPPHWATSFHYNAFVVVPIFCAAVDGARRLGTVDLPVVGRRLRLDLAWAIAVGAIALNVLPEWPFWHLFEKGWWYPRTPATRSAHEAISRVPEGAFVAAANGPGVHMTVGRKVIVWNPPGARHQLEAVWKLEGMRWRYQGDRKLANPPWILADVDRPQFPFESVEQQRETVAGLTRAGYATLFEQDGYVVLHNSALEAENESR
jgi:uncharacterized membrane protein